ncbi:Gfo/Idh/MocA family protein [Microbacterium hominis]|uniref:Gfo/Idh/MocA family oxidoreductase n=1 Tax=Microbacterium hominis TaxID=162426 RepID=A0A7D4Q0Q3_9MICO|nr:Gfo/Idh/MocA family oxidoreductase [Microbacterium hominis]QKJ18331.1 Gfo/Idh/MocA family oxidoreductase [Microbacterium hominis]
MTVSGQPAVRIAVIGAGFMGRQHIEFVHAAAGARLVAVVDPAVTDGEAFGCPLFDGTAAMLEAVRPDAVIIANPNRVHVDTAIECLGAGVAVLLEKPIASTFGDSRRLVREVARRADARLLVGHHRRHHPAIARARVAVREGELGQIVAVSGMWSARKDDAYFSDLPWHREPGAGVMLINVVHDLDLLRHLLGEVAQIQAMKSHHARGLAVEDTISLSLRFDSGAVGSFLASDAGVSPWGWDQATEETAAFPYVPDEIAYRVVGTRAGLSVPNLAMYGYHPSVAADWHSPLSRTYLAAPPRGSFQAQLDHFLDVARGDAPPLVSAEDASRTLALVEAATWAAQTGETVDVERFRVDAIRAADS